MNDCPHHEAIVEQTKRTEKDVNSIWSAIHEVQGDIKGLTGKIGLLVGTITTVNSLVLLIMQYVTSHAK